MSTAGHIRPKIRKTPKAKPQSAAANKLPGEEDEAIKDVCLKMENWVGLGDNKPKRKNASETMFPSTIHIPSPRVEPATNMEDSPPEANSSQPNEPQVKPDAAPKSILKKPKYSKSKPIEMQSEPTESKPQTKTSIFKQDCIKERVPSGTCTPIRFSPEQAASAAMAVEGYQPMMDHNMRTLKEDKRQDGSNDKDEEEGKDLVFNSLADMMKMAGNLPDQDLTKDPQVVEAELRFSCMTQEDYNTELILQGMGEAEEEEDELEQDTTPEWKKPVFQTCQLDAESNLISDEDTIGDEENISQAEDDGLFGLMGGEDDESEEEEAPFTPRSFRILWECLSPLITHESCAFLRRLKAEQETGSSYLFTTSPLTDLETSRANGFLSMLRLYMGRALKELDQPMEMRRTAEQRLHGLLYTFNFSRPAAKLETKHWKALTCILLEMVLFLNQHVSKDGQTPSIPPAAAAADISEDEYRYLVNKTIKIFDTPDPVI